MGEKGANNMGTTNCSNDIVLGTMVSCTVVFMSKIINRSDKHCLYICLKDPVARSLKNKMIKE